ncbi:MAG: hypothetical protein WEB90_03630 [Gemmatimonadota bacterium]
MQRHVLAISCVTAAVLALGGSPAAASAQTFSACRIPAVGVIYMIGVSGAPADCLDPTHVMFSWIEGGQVSDASITTNKLAAGAVTSSKIASGAVVLGHLGTGSVSSGAIIDGTVTAADIGNNAVGSAEIQAGAVGPSELDLEVITVPGSYGAATPVASITANCPAGKRVIAGGYRMTSLVGAGTWELATPLNGPSGDTGWVVQASWSTTPSSWSWNVFATCISGG